MMFSSSIHLLANDKISFFFVYHTFKKELIPILLKGFHEIEREGTLHNSFYQAIITLISKLHKNTTKKRIVSQYL
jgi:hypothetical protein